MRDMSKKRVSVMKGDSTGESTFLVPVEVLRDEFHHGISFESRHVKCTHCGHVHLFPDESYKRVWWNNYMEYFTVHYECPNGDCDGWLADFETMPRGPGMPGRASSTVAR